MDLAKFTYDYIGSQIGLLIQHLPAQFEYSIWFCTDRRQL